MLLGSNASAGVIAFYANRRRYRLEGSLESSYGSFGTYGAKAVVNAPLTADVALRVAGQYSHSDGYARNIRTGEKLQGGESYSGRAQLQVEFGRLTALLSPDYSSVDLSRDARSGVRSPVAVPVVLAALHVQHIGTASGGPRGCQYV